MGLFDPIGDVLGDITGGLFGDALNPPPGSQALTQPGIQFSQALAGPLGSQSLNQGLGTLLQILQGQGQTDPRRFNLLEQSIFRGTEASKNAARGELARNLGGLQSGLGNTLLAAIDTAGAQSQADLRANEAALSEERLRQDLGLLLSFFVPGIDLTGLGLGAQTQANQNQIAATSALLQAIASGVSGGLGGGGGAKTPIPS